MFELFRKSPASLNSLIEDAFKAARRAGANATAEQIVDAAGPQLDKIARTLHARDNDGFVEGMICVHQALSEIGQPFCMIGTFQAGMMHAAKLRLTNALVREKDCSPARMEAATSILTGPYEDALNVLPNTPFCFAMRQVLIQARATRNKSPQESQKSLGKWVDMTMKELRDRDKDRLKEAFEVIDAVWDRSWNNPSDAMDIARRLFNRGIANLSGVYLEPEDAGVKEPAIEDTHKVLLSSLQALSSHIKLLDDERPLKNIVEHLGPYASTIAHYLGRSDFAKWHVGEGLKLVGKTLEEEIAPGNTLVIKMARDLIAEAVLNNGRCLFDETQVRAFLSGSTEILHTPATRTRMRA